MKKFKFTGKGSSGKMFDNTSNHFQKNPTKIRMHEDEFDKMYEQGIISHHEAELMRKKKYK